MKNKIVLFLILLSMYSFGQVPGTETFTLQDVGYEVQPTGGNGLTDMFDEAIPAYFNMTYYNSYYASAGNKYNLLMFRDYGSHNELPSYANNGGLANSTTATINIPYPSGTSAGDGLILAFKIYSGDVNVGSPPSAPSGWTLLGYHMDIGFDYYYAFYYRLPTSGLSGSVTLTHTFSSPISQNGIIYRYVNVGGVNSSLTSVGTYYHSGTIDITATPDSGELGVILSIEFTTSTVTTGGTYHLDSKILDSSIGNVTFVATSITGSGTSENATFLGGYIHGTLAGFSFVK